MNDRPGHSGVTSGAFNPGTAWAWHQTAHPLKTNAAVQDGINLSRAG
jgi:hypothetical protein